MSAPKDQKSINKEENNINDLSTYYSFNIRNKEYFSGYNYFLKKLKDKEIFIKCNYEEIYNISNTDDLRNIFNNQTFFEKEIFDDYAEKIDGPELSLYKEHEKYATKILQLSNGFFIEHIIEQNIKTFSEKITLKKYKNKSDYSIQVKTIKPKSVILVKSEDYSQILLSLNINTFEPFINEINENGLIYAIISEKDNIYAIAFKKNGPEHKTFEIKKNMIIYQILQKYEKEYIISCIKGTYYYKGSIFNRNLFESLKEENKIYELGIKKGILIDKRYVAFIDNSKKDCKGNIIFYDLISKNKFDKFIQSKIPLDENTFTIIDLEKNMGNKKVLLCLCKEGKKSGVLIIKLNSDKLETDKIRENFIEIENFNIQHVCTLKHFLFEEKQFNLYDCNYFIIVGKRIGEYYPEIEIRLYELEDIENNFLPTITWVKNLNIHKITIFDEISFIIQSKTKGNLIMGFINEKTKELNFIEEKRRLMKIFLYFCKMLGIFLMKGKY